MSDTVPVGVAAGPAEHILDLEYAPLPLQTHPIDTAPQQQQGWGPFQGPYSPVNFASAKDVMTGGFGLDITYDEGNNAWLVAPNYAILTLMQDKSVDLVSNQGFIATLIRESGKTGSTSTIAQASTIQTTGVAPTSQGNVGFWGTVRSWLMGEGS